MNKHDFSLLTRSKGLAEATRALKEDAQILVGRWLKIPDGAGPYQSWAGRRAKIDSVSVHQGAIHVILLVVRADGEGFLDQALRKLRSYVKFELVAEGLEPIP